MAKSKYKYFFSFVGERKKNETLQRKLESTQEELMRTQIRYQKEIEKLENQKQHRYVG